MGGQASTQVPTPREEIFVTPRDDTFVSLPNEEVVSVPNEDAACDDDYDEEFDFNSPWARSANNSPRHISDTDLSVQMLLTAQRHESTKYKQKRRRQESPES